MGVEHNDAEAVRWYRLAAAAGDIYAQGNLAERYEEGRGVAKDLAEALRLYELAAKGGNPEAKTRLAHLKAELAKPKQ